VNAPFFDFIVNPIALMAPAAVKLAPEKVSPSTTPTTPKVKPRALLERGVFTILGHTSTPLIRKPKAF
jgi:hypothetical protein